MPNRLPGASLRLLRTRVPRWVTVETTDADGQLRLGRTAVSIALARCVGCKRRYRVLPADVVPHKRYGLAVMARLADAHTLGNRSLRTTAWTTYIGPTPAHSTVHAWTEGLGAHVLGRPFGSQRAASPFQVVLGQTVARWSSLASIVLPKPPIDPLRYRSAARRERLVAVAGLLQLACAVARTITSSCSAPSATAALCTWREFAVALGVSAPFAFQTGIRCTPIERSLSLDRQSAGPPQQTGDPTCQTRTRSPPGDSSRSLPLSIPPSTSRSGEA